MRISSFSRLGRPNFVRLTCPWKALSLPATLFLLFFAGARALDASTAVWLDMDPSLGAPWREVDDAFAFLLARHSPELRLVGISTTYGNASLARTGAVMEELRRAARAEKVPVYEGAAGPGRFDPSPASRALARALEKETNLTYIALGPLTNLAAFQAQHPESARRLRRVIFLGGRRPSDALRFGRTRHVTISDANVVKDPAAAGRVLAGPARLLLVPIEVAAGLRLRPGTREAMLTNDRAGSRFVAKRSGFWLWFWTKWLGLEGGPVFDALAVMAAARPALVEVGPGFARMEGDELVVRETGRAGRPVEVVRRVKSGANVLLQERLAPGR